MIVDSDFQRTVAKRLREARLAIGMSQEGFASAIGASQQAVSRYERGEIPGSWLFLANLKGVVGIDLDGLLG